MVDENVYVSGKVLIYKKIFSKIYLFKVRGREKEGERKREREKEERRSSICCPILLDSSSSLCTLLNEIDRRVY